MKLLAISFSIQFVLYYRLISVDSNEEESLIVDDRLYDEVIENDEIEA